MRGVVWTGAGCIVAAGALAGCVDRRIAITSDPTGATVILNDVEVGRTPLEVDFTSFGTYDVRLRMEGYEPLSTSAEAKAPIHEWPGIDLLAHAWPSTTRTRIEWHFVLEPARPDVDGLVERAMATAALLDDAEAAPDEANAVTEPPAPPEP